MSDVIGHNQPTQEVNLRVGAIRMTLEIPRSEETEQALRKGAEMVNKSIERYRTAFPGAPQVELLSYVALGLASQLHQQELATSELDLEERLRKLNNDLEQVF